MRRTIVLFIAIIFGILFTVSVVKRMWSIYDSGKRLNREQAQVDALEKENNALRQTLRQVNAVYFIEAEARNKLNLSLPGETTVVLDRPQATQTATAIHTNSSNWQRWWHLFFD